MQWTVTFKESVIDDLRWFGKKDGRLLLKEAEERLSAEPLAETANLKTLRPNPVAQREFRLFGKYRVLFNVDEDAERSDDRAGRREAGQRVVRPRKGVQCTS